MLNTASGRIPSRHPAGTVAVRVSAAAGSAERPADGPRHRARGAERPRAVEPGRAAQEAGGAQRLALRLSGRQVARRRARHLLADGDDGAAAGGGEGDGDRGAEQHVADGSALAGGGERRRRTHRAADGEGAGERRPALGAGRGREGELRARLPGTMAALVFVALKAKAPEPVR